MENDDITVQILREIRDKIDATNDRMATREDLRATRDDLHGSIHRLDIRLGETNVRLNAIQARLTDFDVRHGTQMDELLLAFVEARGLEARVSRCEREIVQLKKGG